MIDTSNYNLNILRFFRISSLILICSLCITYISQTYLINEIKKLENKKQITESSYENIHKFIYETEMLLTTYNIEDKKNDFKISYQAYKTSFEIFSKNFLLSDPILNYKEIIDIKIKDIFAILNDDAFNQKNQMYKSILVRFGELNRNEEKSDYFILLKTFIEKVQHLKQYQNFLFEDLGEKKAKTAIELNQDIKFFSFLFTIVPLLIIIGIVIFSFFIDKLIKEKEYNLITTKELLANIINSIPIRVFWKDNAGKYLGANKLFIEDARLENEAQLIGKNDFELTWKDVAQNYVNDDQAVIKSKKPKINIKETQTREDGSLSYLNTSKVPLFDKKANVSGVIGLYEDITDKVYKEEKIKQQEIQLQQQNRLAQMGEMIAMIAHQWRQPLNVISISAGVLLRKIQNHKYEQENFNTKLITINNQVQYLSDTIEDFRNFFKPTKNKEYISSKKLIEDTLNIINPSLVDNNIEVIVETNCDKKLYTYANELKQVLLSILKNSQDAINENKIKNPYIKITAACSTESNCTIIIEDNGGGIPDNIKDKLFDPYFSTKGNKKGTGLGLYMCKMILENHSTGSISVKSANGKTNFTLSIN